MLIERSNFRFGITLVELIISIAITSFIISSTYFIYTFVFKNVNSGQSKLDMQKELRIKLEIVEKDIRNLKEIVCIRKDYLELKIFKNLTDNNFSNNMNSESETYSVIYRFIIDQLSNRNKIIRSVDKIENDFISFEFIDNNIFSAMAYDISGNQVIFDPIINDSFQRERINIINIVFKVRDNNINYEMSSKVVPRFLFGKYSDQNYNLNK